MFNHYAYDPELQQLVKMRWNFLSVECSAVSYMLTPQHAAEGFYVDNDKMDCLQYINKFVEQRFPGLGDKAEEEAAQFMSAMSSLTGATKVSTFKLSAKCYWNVFGQKQYPTLYLLAKTVNNMISSSAASERVWSIYRFLHSRLRNRLANEKVEKLAFIYINCAILDDDDYKYISENGVPITEMDYEDMN